MGGACCVAARERAVVSASGSEGFHRTIRHSPTWSFRWENRGRVAGEDASITWFSDGISRTGGSDIKHVLACALEDRNVLESFGRPTLQKSPASQGTSMPVRTPGSDQSISRNVSMDASLDQVKDMKVSPLVLNPSPAKLSVSLPSTSSLPTSPFSSGSHPHPASLTTLRWHSFDDEYMNFNSEKSASNNGQLSVSSSVDLQVCGICTKQLVDRSFWSSQKLVASNELPVVAVLICGHFYHAECLETMTSEFSKYDPSCPICTLGEKQTLKLSRKAIKAELEMKAGHKRSKNWVVEGDLDGDPFEFDGLKGYGDRDLEGPRMASSSRMRKSLAKPFLRRHFSTGSKSQTTKRKGFFWTRSTKG